MNISLYFILFVAGLLTILLPCILPLIPIVLGVSIAGRSRLRPLLTVLGMMISFVGLTFLLLTALNQFTELADYIQIATYYILLLFGIGFAVHNRSVALILAALGGLFFFDKGPVAVIVAMIAGIIAFLVGGKIATVIQEVGTGMQAKAREEFGADSPLTALVMGLTLGLVWVPCAGPALSFALTLVRNQPGPQAILALTAYALGTALPLLLIGYGQTLVHSVRSFSKYTGVVKTVAGVLLIVSAIGLKFNLFQDFQVWLASNTRFGDIGTRIEEQLVGDRFNPSASSSSVSGDSASSTPTTMTLPVLPTITRAPEFDDLGPWHNSEPFTLASLKGKVVLVDFWTYSCINCIRTLPYIQGYWTKYKDTGKFVLIGVHSPEFTFEKSQKNVAMAITKYGLTYPVAQDNNFGTWKQFANHYWPAKYLIDANGYIRYEHFGEGSYEETDAAIASLLKEAGVDVSGMMDSESASSSAQAYRGASPETYIGSRSWPAFGNRLGEPDTAAHAYNAPTTFALNKYYLDGTWQLAGEESQILLSDAGEIAMRFKGAEMNLVLGLIDGVSSVTADVWIDGKMSKTITIAQHDLYNLYKGEHGEYTMVLKFHGKGVEAFAFTFGG